MTMTSEEYLREKQRATILLDRADRLFNDYFLSLSTCFNNYVIENTDKFLAGERRAIIEISLNSLIHTKTKRSLLWYYTQHAGLSEAAIEHLISSTKARSEDDQQERKEALNELVVDALNGYRKKFSAELFTLELRFRSVRKHAGNHTNGDPWAPAYAFNVFRLWLMDMGLLDNFEFELLQLFDQSFADIYAAFLLSLNELFRKEHIPPATLSRDHILEPTAALLKSRSYEIESLYADAHWIVAKTDKRPEILVDKKFRYSPINSELPDTVHEEHEPPTATTLSEKQTLNSSIEDRLDSTASPHDEEIGPTKEFEPTNTIVPSRSPSKDLIPDIDRGTVLDFLDNANNWQRRRVISFDRDARSYLMSGHNTQEHRSEDELIELYQTQKLRILAAPAAKKGLYSRIIDRLSSRKSAAGTDGEPSPNEHKASTETSV